MNLHKNGRFPCSKKQQTLNWDEDSKHDTYKAFIGNL